MPNPQARFKRLSGQFETLVVEMEKSTDREQRRQLLQRMKALIDEIDRLVASSLKENSTQTPASNSQ